MVGGAFCYAHPVKKTLAALSALILFILSTFAFLGATATPAQAGQLCDSTGQCGTIWHTTDAGYDRAIKIRCNFGDPDSFQDRKSVV